MEESGGGLAEIPPGSEAHLRRLLELSPIPCILTNPRMSDNPIIAANAAFAALTGYPLDEVIGRNCRFLSGPATEAEGRTKLKEAIDTGTPAVVALTNYRRDGSTFRNAVMIAPILDEAGELAFFMGSQMEASPAGSDGRKRAAAEKIATLSRRQLEVLTAMAHGLRHAQIATDLGINEKTVKMHRGALVKKLDCRTSAEAIRLAIEAGL